MKRNLAVKLSVVIHGSVASSVAGVKGNKEKSIMKLMLRWLVKFKIQMVLREPPL